MTAQFSSSRAAATEPKLDDRRSASSRVSISNADTGIAAPDCKREHGESPGFSPRSGHELEQSSGSIEQRRLSSSDGARLSNIQNPTHPTTAADDKPDDATSPTKRPKARQSQSAHQGKPAPPISLAGPALQEDVVDLEAGHIRAPSTSESALAQRRKDRSSRASRSAAQGHPPGVAVPMPQPRKRPTWATRGATKQPLYSLGKPLPTHEEVQAQKAWEEQMNRIKEQYPEAQPPEPPPLPSQTANTSSGAGALGMSGTQIDRDQLQDVIRAVIAEFYGLQTGEVPLESLQNANRAPAIGTRRRTSFHDPGSTSNGRGCANIEGTRGSAALRARLLRDVDENGLQGGSDLETLDSMVVDDEDDEPLPEGRVSRSRHRAPILWSRRNGKKFDDSESPRHGISQPRSGDTAAQDSSERMSGLQPAVPGRRLSEQRRQTSTQREEGQSEDVQPALPAVPEKRGNNAESHEGGDGELTAVPTRTNSTEGVEEAARPKGNGNESLVFDADEDIPESQGDYDPDYQGDGDDFPNPIARYRSYVREEAAEFLGAFVLSVIGTGANAQMSLSMNEAISPSGQGSLSHAVNLTGPLAWGIGVAVSVYIAGGISGGHISPTITIVLALFRGFPWRKVPGYMAAQILGFIVGSATAYGLYRHAISLVEGAGDIRTLGTAGTASYLATYPNAYVSNANAFFNEFTDTTILLVLVLAIGDVNGVPPPAGLNPLVLMFTITAIMLSLGVQTGACLNPSRDLGPRLVSWWAGYGTGVWEDRSHYWLWLWPADILGGAFGAILYDVLIFTGEESPVNRRWSWRAFRLAAFKHRFLAWRWRQKVKTETRKASHKETGQTMGEKSGFLRKKEAEAGAK